jgi:mRNA-decapping enzyme subunit 2
MRAFEEFLTYKTRVPVRGAIMLNEAMDSVVLVKGWKKGANWSFPRGKINKDEDDLDCAVREVYEETGYDIKEAGLVPEEEQVKYIEITMREQHMRLYVFRNIPMDTYFEPRTRKEISKIEWYRLSDLPAFRKKGQQQTLNGAQAAVNANKFYMVAPFLVPLKKWIIQQQKKDAQKAASSHFLAPVYTEDAMTEEETGTDRAGSSYYPESKVQTKTVAPPGIDTLEGATAALHRLLKIQPPTQGLQPASATQSPATKNSGDALLALLQGKAVNSGPILSNLQSVRQPHTPLDHTIISAPVPQTPSHHQPPRHTDLPFSSMLPPPPFSLQPSHESNLYSPRQQPYVQQLSGYPNIPQNQMHHQPFLPQQPQNYARHSDQSQQLQHPQPLPPQVQRAVFTGGQVHGPLMSQTVHQQPDARFSDLALGTIQHPQFPNVHGPGISSSMNQTQPKLTSHSLALLNAFKSQDQVTSIHDRGSDLPSHHLGQLHDVRPVPQDDLPGRYNPAELSGDDMAVPAVQLLPSRTVPSEQHRSSLLNMFKAPVSKPSPSDATNVSDESLKHLNRHESHTQASTHLDQSGVVMSSQSADAGNRPSHVPKTASPFKPVAILTRPPQPNASISLGLLSAGLETPKARKSGKSKPPEMPKGVGGSPKRTQTGTPSSSSSGKTFQPQILKRPQPNNKQSPSLPTELAAPNPAIIPSLPFQSSHDKRPSQPTEHKQNLLSLFGKVSTVSSPPLFDQPKAGIAAENPYNTANIAARSRIGSLASNAGEAAISGRRGSQTPTSPADKAFLLGYLDGITKDSGR